MLGIFDTVSLRQCVVALCKFVVALCLSLGAIGAQAAVLDRIDVVTRSSDAQIVVRFSTRISYLRHVPQSNGKEVRVFLRLLDFPQPESGLTQETLRAPRTDRVPDITVQYPEVNDAMLVSFSLATRFYVRAGEDGRSIVLTVPLLTAEGKTAPPQPAPVQRAPVEPPATTGAPPPAGSGAAAAAPLSPDEIEERARALIYGAREALRAKSAALAISRLNRILTLPRNRQTEPAQALIGEARELNGEIDKARAEYELYLRLFPDGPSLVRVSERLAALPSGAQAPRAKRPLPKEAGPGEWSYNGSLSTYFYLGKSQIETLVAPPPGQLTYNRDTLSAVDQRSLITSLNLNARRRDAFTDTRIVFRNTDNHNFLRPSRSYNRVYSAYVDHVDRNRGYSVRLGRQNPNGIGVLERFDGLQAGYNLNDTWRVNGVYGSAVEFTSPFDKSFHGLSLELVSKLGRPGVSAYAIEQNIDGHLNRRAVGTEVRYFDGRATAYGMLDYDLLYGGVNIALVQGNYLDAAGNNYFFVIDHRRAPSFGLTNALPGGQGLSLNEMISAQGIDTVRREAVSLTAVSDMLSFGVTRKLSENWQLGVDYRMSEISGTAPVEAVIPLSVIGTCLGTIDTVNNNCILSTGAFQGSGKSHALTFQAIGSNLWFPGAVGVSNLSFIFAPTFKGQALSLAYLAPIGTQWRIDTNLRYYRQSDDSGASQTRLSPSIKVSWHWRDRVYLEGEIGEEIWRSDAPDRQDRTSRAYLYTGLRWDFR